MQQNHSKNLIKEQWEVNDIPDQGGKTAVVTGGNSGLGYEVSKSLASKGAQVILACRNLDKGREAIEKIDGDAPQHVMQLDLADLSSIRLFCDEFLKKHQSLHMLFNNAGVMQAPQLRTIDGFELQLGTNHLGHFALTGLLLKRILGTEGSRIITVSSGAHRTGNIDFSDIMKEKKYGRLAAYAQSKLANLLFAYELQRRLDLLGSSTISVAAHPGYAATNLQTTGPGMGGGWGYTTLYKVTNKLLAQSALMGALPMLYAATAKDVKGGDYYGPGSLGGMRGYAKLGESNEKSHDENLGRQLWERSVELTKVGYEELLSSKSH